MTNLNMTRAFCDMMERGVIETCEHCSSPDANKLNTTTNHKMPEDPFYLRYGMFLL